jgi:protein with PEP-CTERM/exosortase system signal
MTNRCKDLCLTSIPAFFYGPFDVDVCGLLGFPPSGKLGPAVISRIGSTTREITMKMLILAVIRGSLMFTAVTASLFSIRPAQANYIVTLQQVGPNVVATGSGAFDLTGLPVKAGGSSPTLIEPFLGNIVTGSSNSCDVYGTTITGPNSFGTGIQAFANNGIGDIVGMLFNGGHEPFLVVPVGYVSGTALSDSATYNNLTLITFATPGTYVWTWGDGADQRFTLQIESVGVPGVPDGGSTVSLLGCALLGLAALRRKLPLLRGRKS